jgi:hypothetical protein
VVILIAVAASVFDLKTIEIKDTVSSTTLSPLGGLYIFLMSGWVFDVALASRQAQPSPTHGRWLEIALGLAVASAALGTWLALLSPAIFERSVVLRNLAGVVVTIGFGSFFILCAQAATALARQTEIKPSRWTMMWHFYAMLAAPLGAWMVRPKLMMLRDKLRAASS